MTDNRTEAPPSPKPPRTLFRAGTDVIPISIIDGEPHLLLATMGRGPHRGRRGTIGGHLDDRDTFAEAGARELLEEAGLRATPDDLIPLTFLDDPDRDVRDGVRGLGRVFLVDADRISGEPEAGDDVAHVEWVALSDLIDLLVKGEETFAYDHAEGLAAACLYLTSPRQWPPTPPAPVLSALDQLAVGTR